jgi:hypothetical protein
MKPRDYRGGWPWLIAALIAGGLVAWASYSARRPSVTAPASETAKSIAAQPAAPVAVAPDPAVTSDPVLTARTTKRATPSHATPPRVASAQPSAPRGTAGMVVGIDPETGQLGAPTAEQLRDLSRLAEKSVSKTPEGLTEIHLADGTVIATLDGRFEEHIIMSIGPDGKPKYGCVHGDDHAHKAMKSTTPVPVLEEK